MGHTVKLTADQLEAIERGDLIPVVGYGRISKDDEKDGHGVEDQRKDNGRNAKRQRWIVVHHFEDNDRSASKANVVREDFEEMLRVLRRGKMPSGAPVRGVIVVHEDRLVRRPGDYERFVEAVTADDGRVYADERGPKDLYADDVEAMGLMGAVISKIETRKMRKRMKNNHRRRAEDGLPPRGMRRFGWSTDKSTAHPVEGPLLAQAARDIAGGRSVSSVAREWRQKDVRSSKGNLWTANTLRVAVTSPRLCGYRAIRGELVRDENGKPVIGSWEALVEPAIWEAIDALFKARAGKSVGPDGQPVRDLPFDRREYRFLLTGILRCGKPRADGTLCGSRLRVTRLPNVGWHNYSCPGSSTGGCGGVARQGPPVDEHVSEAVLAKLEDASAFEVEDAVWPSQDEHDAVAARLARLQSEWTAGRVSDNVFFSTVQALENQLAELRADRRRFIASARRTISNVTDIRERWFSSDPDRKLDTSQKRAYIRLALHAVIMHPAGKGFKPFNPDLLELRWRDSIAVPSPVSAG